MPNKKGKRVLLGERIKRLRQEKGWSQAQFAKKLDAHQKQVSGYERGAHAPSTEMLIKMAAVLGISLDYLVFDDRPDTRKTNIADLDLLGDVLLLGQCPIE